MNTDLFQSLTVALLGAITILLIAAIAALVSIKRALGASGSALRDLAQGSGEGSVELVGEAVDERAAATEPSSQVAQEAQAEAVSAAAGSTNVTSEVPGERRDATAGAVSASAQERETSEEAAAEAAAEPEEQPFERDGRWWFRRGDELLVYDEQTAQWLRAEGSSTRAVYGQERAAEQGAVATESRTTTYAEPSRADEAGSQGSAETSNDFWKCPACGAANGIAATSCRMCFTARP